MKKVNFLASPGIAIIKEIEEQDNTALSFGSPKTSRVIKGEIIAMGANLITDADALLEADRYGKVGDIVYFLHYYDEGGHDIAYVDNKKYYTVKWQDFRFILNNE